MEGKARLEKKLSTVDSDLKSQEMKSRQIEPGPADRQGEKLK